MDTIRIITNEYPGGWSPEEYYSGMLGGSEEAVILLSEEFSKLGFDVIVYHQKQGDTTETTVLNEVKYSQFEDLTIHERDIVISFKSIGNWHGVLGQLSYKKDTINIHWSCDIEKPHIQGPEIDAVVHLTEFHKSMNFWIESNKSKTIQLGIDTELLENNKVAQDENSILYCSSLDRGLVTLLEEWPQIKKHHPKMKLRIAYGMNHLQGVAHRVPEINQFIDKLFELMKQPGIEYLGALTKEDISKEYWRNKYWCLPLIIAGSELFCLNAVKAQYCGAVSVVNKMGALRNTVGNYIDFKKFVDGDLTIIEEAPGVGVLSWNEVAHLWIGLFLKIRIEKDS